LGAAGFAFSADLSAAGGAGFAWLSAVFSAGFAAGLSPAFSVGPISLRKRISAGSSMVELADLTNSPISLNFSRTNLLSTPNSLASSWTRVLATLLLLATDPDPGD